MDTSSATNVPQLLKPINKFPVTHPLQTKKWCGGTKDDNSFILEEDNLCTACDDSQCNECKSCELRPGYEAFYALNVPEEWSANIGFEEDETVMMYFMQQRTKDGKVETYLVMTFDKPGVNQDKNDYGTLSIYADSPDLAGEGTEIAVCDDEYECNPDNKWNSETGKGWLGSWTWKKCCTDGVMFGPFPDSNFCFNMRFDNVNGIQKVKVGSYNDETGDIDFLEYGMDAILSGFSTCGYTCEDYCRQKTSCGECTSDPVCGWCDGSCLHKSAASTCSEDQLYIPHGQNCPECIRQSCTSCLSNPACGWCFATGKCSSVFAYDNSSCVSNNFPVGFQLANTYFGEECSYCEGAIESSSAKVSVDPNKEAVGEFCSGHGQCLSTQAQQTSELELMSHCQCESGFTGGGCEFSCPNACSGHGTCDSGICICDCGYEGEGCQTLTTSQCEGQHNCIADGEHFCFLPSHCEAKCGLVIGKGECTGFTGFKSCLFCSTNIVNPVVNPRVRGIFNNGISLTG